MLFTGESPSLGSLRLDVGALFLVAILVFDSSVLLQLRSPYYARCKLRKELRAASSHSASC